MVVAESSARRTSIFLAFSLICNPFPSRHLFNWWRATVERVT
jgi:hypothetical protein